MLISFLDLTLGIDKRFLMQLYFALFCIMSFTFSNYTMLWQRGLP